MIESKIVLMKVEKAEIGKAFYTESMGNTTQIQQLNISRWNTTLTFINALLNSKYFADFTEMPFIPFNN